jgi:hypothetical protein
MEFRFGAKVSRGWPAQPDRTRELNQNSGTETADDADMQELAASAAITRWVSVFSRIARPNYLHPRNLHNPRSISSPFSAKNSDGGLEAGVTRVQSSGVYAIMAGS